MRVGANRGCDSYVKAILRGLRAPAQIEPAEPAVVEPAAPPDELSYMDKLLCCAALYFSVTQRTRKCQTIMVLRALTSYGVCDSSLRRNDESNILSG